MRIVRYFKNHLGAVLLVILLLFVKAGCDLALPVFTSQIVDVGIQMSGVEDVATEVMTEDTYESALALVPADEEAFVKSCYDRQSNGAYSLNQNGVDQRQRLNDLLTVPMIVVHGNDGEPVDGWRAMEADYRAGAASKEQVLAFADESEESTDTSMDTRTMTEQRALTAARAEYEAAGFDLYGMEMGYLARVALLMLAFAAGAAVIDIAVSLVASRTGASIGRDLRQRLFERIVAFSEGEISRFTAASLITRGTNDITLIQNVCIMLLRMVLYAPILAIGGIVMVMVTNASLGWIVVVAVIIVFAVIAVLFKFTLPRFKIMQKLIDRVNLVAREMLTGLPVVRAFGREDFEEERFDRASGRLMRTQLFTNRAMAAMMPTMMLVMNLTSVAIVWFGGGAIDRGMLQTGDLIAFITYAMVIIMGFLMLGMISIMLPRADVAAGRIDEVIATVPAVVDPKRPVIDPFDGARTGAAVEFKDVSFRYDEHSDDVLEHLSFTAAPGTTTAVVGSTGSGKSTVMKLVERFVDASEGAVLVDGIDVRDLAQADLRAQFGYVPQKAFLFSGTVEENVRYGWLGTAEGDAHAALEAAEGDVQAALEAAEGDVQAALEAAEGDVQAALEAACAADFVASMPEGVESELSQGGTNVSGGQRQRLAMARALVRRPRAYLFDDSFSALDFATDAQLRRNLNSYAANATKLIVAQRLSTVLDADQIIVLDEGKMVGRGTHCELMENCEAYREIALSQLSEAELAEAGCE